MNYADVQELGVHQGTPSVSLYIACDNHRGCHNKITQQCMQAAARVCEVYGHTDGEHLASTLKSLASSVAVREHTKSVALFVNKYIAWAYALPYEVQDTIFVADHFIVEEVVQHLARAVRYWVLVLFHGKPFLFEGYEGTISEVVHRHNTQTGGEHINLNDLAGRVCGASVWHANCRYPDVTQFIRAVDRGLAHFIEADPLPLVCCADKESLEAFRQYSYYADRILLSLPLDHLYPLEDLQFIVWPLFQKSYTHLQDAMLTRLREACKVHLCALGVSAVWRALHEGRVQFLCVAKNYSKVMCELPQLNAMVDSSMCHDGHIQDGIALLVKEALREGVPLCWYEDKELLQEFSYVAAIVSSGDQETPASS